MPSNLIVLSSAIRPYGICVTIHHTMPRALDNVLRIDLVFQRLALYMPRNVIKEQLLPTGLTAVSTKGGVGGEAYFRMGPVGIIRGQWFLAKYIQYGGGKTHGLIALTHLAHGMNGVADPMEFIDPALVPRAGVQVAAFDGENAEPISGRKFEGGVTAYTPWGEIAYGLGGVEGYERVKENDIERVPPGADTLRTLFGGKPTLILVDELSVYLRAVRGRKEEGQFTLFMTNLCSAVESSERAALVLTLAIGKDGATDAYQKENEYVAREFEEIEHVLGEDIVRRLEEQLDYPDTDPHGRHIPGVSAETARETSV